MIVEFKRPEKKEKVTHIRNLKKEAEELNNDSKDLDFGAIAAMMCGQELTEDQKGEVEKFNDQYDKMQDLDSWH